MADRHNLLELTADVVAAHVSNNRVAVGDVPALVANVHAALATLGAPPTETLPTKTKVPAVSVRASVKPDLITCLECGSKHKMLKRHLQTAHAITPADYRGLFGLPNSYPMVAPEYAQRRSELAKKSGLGSAGRGSRPEPQPQVETGQAAADEPQLATEGQEGTATTQPESGPTLEPGTKKSKLGSRSIKADTALEGGSPTRAKRRSRSSAQEA